MVRNTDPLDNFEETMRAVGYVPRREAEAGTYASLGFKSGLEIHQQLKTEKKLFCRCPAGIYQEADDFDAEVIRHMRPTLSELGEYDGTALMEFRTRKNIIYRIKNETACTYEIDDTPPFPIDREALGIAIEIALLLKTNIVGELHITRKQYLDGSIPTGFQRTAIVGIEGEIPLSHKKVRIIQLSIEEDSCREVSDVGHWRTYTTDRLGMPLIEMVTYPDMLTPDEAAEAGHYLRFLSRSSGHVRTGIGAARQDVNVSISGGTRVEIKGVQHIAWIPELTHTEAFRQKALLDIKDTLNRRTEASTWKATSKDIDYTMIGADFVPLQKAQSEKWRLAAVNLPHFKNILSHFTQPGRPFAHEIRDRLKVIACLEKPNMLHSEQGVPVLSAREREQIAGLFKAGPDDAQIVVWGPDEDVTTAIETIEERCQLAFDGVPNETRKSMPDGTTLFERVLPGPDRMYPDTDSAPIPIEDEDIQKVRDGLPRMVDERLEQLEEWQVPRDTYHYLLKRNFLPVMERIVGEKLLSPRYVGALLGHTLKYIEGHLTSSDGFTYNKLLGLARFIKDRGLDKDIIKTMLPVVYEHPKIEFESVLTTVGYKKADLAEIMGHVPALSRKFREINTSKDPGAETDWIMGKLRKMALGNVALKELKARIDKESDND